MAAATNSTLGTICLAGDLAGTSSVPELAATGVKAKAYDSVSKIHVDSKGRIQWCGGANFATDIEPSIPQAASGTAGVFRIGPNINVNSGTISVNIASEDLSGIFKVGNNLEINQSTGALDVVLPTASASQKGVFQVGSGFAISAGVLSRDGADRNTSTTVKGVAKIGSNFNIDSGTLSVPSASTSVAGVAIVDPTQLYLDTASNVLYPHACHSQLWGMVNGFSSDFSISDGVLSYTSPYSSVVASASTLGMVKIGTGLYMSGDNALTVAQDASTSTKGFIEANTGFSVSSGVLSAGIGSESAFGIVCIGESNTTLMAYNTISNPGYPEDGTSGLRFRRCDIGVNNLAYPGIVRSADTGNISINNGVMDTGVNIPRKDLANTFNKAQVVASQVYVDTDWSRGNNFTMTLSSNVTSVPAPTNAVPGQVVNLIIKQDATGGRTLTGWNSVYKFASTLTLSTAANAVDIITIICKSSTEFFVLSSLGYQ